MPCINVPKLDKHGANAIERLRHAHKGEEREDGRRKRGPEE